jgi:hypothetical protein
VDKHGNRFLIHLRNVRATSAPQEACRNLELDKEARQAQNKLRTGRRTFEDGHNGRIAGSPAYGKNRRMEVERNARDYVDLQNGNRIVCSSRSEIRNRDSSESHFPLESK